jgi:hypothetical protein
VSDPTQYPEQEQRYRYRLVDADGSSPSSVYEERCEVEEACARRFERWPEDGSPKIQRQRVGPWEDVAYAP